MPTTATTLRERFEDATSEQRLKRLSILLDDTTGRVCHLAYLIEAADNDLWEFTEGPSRADAGARAELPQPDLETIGRLVVWAEDVDNAIGDLVRVRDALRKRLPSLYNGSEVANDVAGRAA